MIVRADARRLPLAADSVDLIVTSPPYFALRSYTDGGEHYAGQIGSEGTPAEYVANLIECTREWVRVLKPSGSMWVNLGDKYSGAGPQNAPGRLSSVGNSHHWRQVGKSGIPAKSLMGLPWRYALACIDELGLILRAEVIWSKPNGLPESVTDRVRRSHEQWFHFTRSPRYFSSVDEIRDAYAPGTAARYAAGYGARPLDAQRRTVHTKLGDQQYDQNPLGKLPGSVWSIPSEPLTVPTHLGVDHFAAFPTEWPRRIVLGWSPPAGTVLDPFGGTGTTALVADVLGRRGISVDMSADYCRLARWRTTDPGERARAMRVDKPDPIAEAQLNLFEEVGV